MKTLSKLFVVMISLALLTGCNLFGEKDLGTEDIDQEVQEIMEAEHDIDEALDQLESEDL